MTTLETIRLQPCDSSQQKIGGIDFMIVVIFWSFQKNQTHIASGSAYLLSV